MANLIFFLPSLLWIGLSPSSVAGINSSQTYIIFFFNFHVLLLVGFLPFFLTLLFVALFICVFYHLCILLFVVLFICVIFHLFSFLLFVVLFATTTLMDESLLSNFYISFEIKGRLTRSVLVYFCCCFIFKIKFSYFGQSWWLSLVSQSSAITI